MLSDTDSGKPTARCRARQLTIGGGGIKADIPDLTHVNNLTRAAMIAKTLFTAKTFHSHGVEPFRDHESQPAGYPDGYSYEGACLYSARRASLARHSRTVDQPPAWRPAPNPGPQG